MSEISLPEYENDDMEDNKKQSTKLLDINDILK